MVRQTGKIKKPTIKIATKISSKKHLHSRAGRTYSNQSNQDNIPPTPPNPKRGWGTEPLIKFIQTMDPTFEVYGIIMNAIQAVLW